MRLILVRHGESVGNLENRLQGHADYDLTDLGRQQASLTANRLADMRTTRVYTSPLLRAAQTASLIGLSLSLKPEELADVSEYRFGELSGQTYADVRRHFEGSGAGAAEQRVYPGEEGRQAFFDRVTTAIWSVIDRHPAETVAVVSHGGPIALFCQTVLGLPYRRPMPFSIGNCSITVVEAEHRDRAMTLLSLNDTRHLR